MDHMWNDLRHGVRLLRTHPGFTAVAVVTLALGIGANTAIFSAAAALLLRPLPVAEPDRLVFGLSLREGFDPFNTSLVEYAAYRRSRVFASSGVALQRSFTIMGHDEPERVRGAAVSGGFLATIGTLPAFGRPITDDDDKPAAAPAAIIGYGLWQRRFGGRPEAIGSALYSASQRTGEIGLRMALGAGPRDVLVLMMRQAIPVVGGGLAAGVLLARAVSLVIAGTLYRVDANNPAAFFAVAVALAAVCAAACFVPAWRATRVDPMAALNRME